jgi:hypothetical protein
MSLGRAARAADEFEGFSNEAETVSAARCHHRHCPTKRANVMPTDLVGRKLAVSIRFDTVTIDIICGNEYLAQVFYEDITERLQAGQAIELGIGPAAPTSPDTGKAG